MAFAAGGKLASAVSSAGGLGLIGSADGDIDWLSEQFEVADNPKNWVRIYRDMIVGEYSLCNNIQSLRPHDTVKRQSAG